MISYIDNMHPWYDMMKILYLWFWSQTPLYIWIIRKELDKYQQRNSLQKKKKRRRRRNSLQNIWLIFIELLKFILNKETLKNHDIPKSLRRFGYWMQYGILDRNLELEDGIWLKNEDIWIRNRLWLAIIYQFLLFSH